MSFFYAFMSIVFAVFTYFVSLDNGASKRDRWLVSLLMLLFWPLVMIVITTYLIILHTHKEKDVEEAAAEVVESVETEWDNLEEVKEEVNTDVTEEVEDENNN